MKAGRHLIRRCSARTRTLIGPPTLADHEGPHHLLFRGVGEAQPASCRNSSSVPAREASPPRHPAAPGEGSLTHQRTRERRGKHRQVAHRHTDPPARRPRLSAHHRTTSPRWIGPTLGSRDDGPVQPCSGSSSSPDPASTPGCPGRSACPGLDAEHRGQVGQEVLELVIALARPRTSASASGRAGRTGPH